MQFALKQPQQHEHLARFLFVAALHVVLIYFFAAGLGRTISQVFSPPPIVVINQEPTPRDPPKVIQFEPVKPTTTIFNVAIDNPLPIIHEPTTDRTFTPTTDTGTHSDILDTEARPSTHPATGNVAMPATIAPGIACPNSQQVRQQTRYPAAAYRNEIEGNVLARFILTPTGEVGSISIIESASPLFNSTVIAAIKQFRCVAQGREAVVQVPFSFRLNN